MRPVLGLLSGARCACVHHVGRGFDRPHRAVSHESRQPLAAFERRLGGSWRGNGYGWCPSSLSACGAQCAAFGIHLEVQEWCYTPAKAVAESSLTWPPGGAQGPEERAHRCHAEFGEGQPVQLRVIAEEREENA